MMLSPMKKNIKTILCVSFIVFVSVLLSVLGVEVEVLTMPNTNKPTYHEWLSYLQTQIIGPYEDSYLVGHSLGCITIVQYLNNFKADVKIGGAILVAGFISPIHFKELDGFFEVPLDEAKIRNSVKRIVAINSDNDPHIPYSQAEEIEKRLGAELIKIHNGGHLNEKTGYNNFPLVLKKLKELMGL